MGFPGGSGTKNVPEMEEHGFNPWTRKIPWRRYWQPTLVFFPGQSYGQRSLGRAAGGGGAAIVHKSCNESDTAEATDVQAHMYN